MNRPSLPRHPSAHDSDVSSGWSSADDEAPKPRTSQPPPSRVTPPPAPPATTTLVSSSSSSKVQFKAPHAAAATPTSGTDLAALYRSGQQLSAVTNEKLLAPLPNATTVGRTSAKPSPGVGALATPPSAPAVAAVAPDTPTDPNKKKKRKKRVVVNLSRCKYDIVRECVEGMGWTVDDDQEGLAAFANMLKETKEKDAGLGPTPVWSPGGVAGTAGSGVGGAATNAGALAAGQVDVSALLTALLQSERCQILWSDVSVLTQNVARLKPWQRVNHFPQMSLICRKVQLGKQLNRMAALFPDEYDFFPLSFSSRSDLSAIAAYCRKTKNKKTFILKPNAGCQGIGIVLSRQPDKIIPMLPHEDYIVQLYVTRPLLIEKKKFDMRVYVLVLSVSPLKVLIYDEGLVRMCTKDYVKPKPSNMSQTTMHLTNYAVNKKSDDFAFGGAQSGQTFTTETGRTFTDDGDGSKGYKRDFAFLRRFIEANFGEHMYKLLWQRIERAVVLTILSAYHQIKHAYSASNPCGKGSDNRTCFELLGFDVLLDDECNPYVLEVNHSPSFGTDSAIDYRIKRRLLMDVLKHINPYIIDVKRASEHQYRNMLKKKVWEDADLYLMGTGFRPIYPPEAIVERVRQKELKQQLKEQKEAALRQEGGGGGGDDSGSEGDDVVDARPSAPTPGQEEEDEMQPLTSAGTDGGNDDDKARQPDDAASDDEEEEEARPAPDANNDALRLWSYEELRELYDTVMEATAGTLPGQTSLRTQKAMASFTNAARRGGDGNDVRSGVKPVVAENRAAHPHSAPLKPSAPKSAAAMPVTGTNTAGGLVPSRSSTMSVAAGSGASAARRKSIPNESTTNAAAPKGVGPSGVARP